MDVPGDCTSETYSNKLKFCGGYLQKLAQASSHPGTAGNHHIPAVFGGEKEHGHNDNIRSAQAVRG